MRPRIIACAVLMALWVVPGVSRAAGLTERLTGHILLQVESRGEAWYVNPTDEARYYMKDGPTAYEMLRHFGLGISEDDYQRLLGGELVDRLKGRIILRVQAHGEAYYIHPDGSIHYLKDGEAAYQVMRSLSLGITNADLGQIKAAELTEIVIEPVAEPMAGVVEPVQTFTQEDIDQITQKVEQKIEEDQKAKAEAEAQRRADEAKATEDAAKQARMDALKARNAEIGRIEQGIVDFKVQYQKQADILYCDRADKDTLTDEQTRIFAEACQQQIHEWDNVEQMQATWWDKYRGNFLPVPEWVFGYLWNLQINADNSIVNNPNYSDTP